MTFNQLVAMVEKQGWVYSDGESYTCSPFVTGIYKAAGLFGNLEINPSEFTPRDVYMLNFFDLKNPVSDKCSPKGLGYC